jgi:hypothetical protein
VDGISSNTLTILLYSSCLHYFWREVWCHSYPWFSVGKVIFFFWLLSRFFCLWISVVWTWYVQSVTLYLSAKFLSPSWICGSVSIINFGKFSVFISSNISSISLLCYTFCYYSTILRYSVPVFSFLYLFVFQFKKFLLTYLQVHRFFP